MCDLLALPHNCEYSQRFFMSISLPRTGCLDFILSLCISKRPPRYLTIDYDLNATLELCADELWSLSSSVLLLDVHESFRRFIPMVARVLQAWLIQLPLLPRANIAYIRGYLRMLATITAPRSLTLN